MTVREISKNKITPAIILQFILALGLAVFFSADDGLCVSGMVHPLYGG